MLAVTALVPAVFTAASAAYCLMCVMAGSAYAGKRRRPSLDPPSLPPVSLLKPLRGSDPEMYASLRSHCLQRYPEYEILFGVSDPGDPALVVVERLKKEFPDCSLRIVICNEHLGANGKVSNLVQMARVAKHEIFIVSDSDIRVEPNYLHTIVTELQQPGIALVTCLYRGVPVSSLGSRTESLGIATDFMPGVLAAQLVEGKLKFALGATLAFRRQELEKIGGLRAVLDYLADDYQIGSRMADSAGKVVVSRSIVETFLPAYSFAEFFSHQLRWARTIRVSRLWGYTSLPLTFTFPWALSTLFLAHGATWAWMLFGIAVLARGAMAVTIGKYILHDRKVLPSLWLLPLRDLLGVIVWVAGWFGQTIRWRGQRFRLRGGKLERA